MTHENMLARYKILHELGRGPTGAVYAARNRTTEALVALKRLDPALLKSDASFAQRVLKHARSARQLRHRNIVELHEAGETAGTVYVAMQMLEGESLRKILDAGPLAIARAIRIAHGIAGGLAYAHLEGVLHGAINPSNIIVLRSGVVQITDFGIGRPGQGYMSPEQMRGDPIDHRSDVFSLGALFYEMLTQRPACQSDLPPPSELNPHVPRVLDAIVLSMLTAQPADRMPGVPVLLRELERLEEGLGLGSGASVRTDEPAASAPPAAPEPVANAEVPNLSRTTHREPPDYHEAIAIMERESRLERTSRSRAAVFAGLALVLTLLGLGGAGFMGVIDFTQLAGFVDDWSGRTPEPSAVAVATKEPAMAPAAPPALPPPEVVETRPEESSAVASAGTPVPPEPLAPEPRPSAPAESLLVRGPEPEAKAEKRKSQPNRTATLILAVSPRGEIYINGEPAGMTPPITKFDLEPGMHRIEVRSGSRRPYLTYMTVQAGDVRRIRHDFNAKPVRPPR